MAKCEFNKDAAPLRDCFWNSYFEGTPLSECFHILLLFKVLRCLFVSLTTDTLSKAIMELSSAQHFSNVVSVKGEVGWCWGYTPSGISRT